MTTLDLLSKLRNLDIRLWAEDGQLRYSAPDGVLTSELLTQLAERKSEIIAYLRAGTAATLFAPLPTIVPAPADRYQLFPLTDIQQAYWIGRSASFELGNVATHAYLEFENTGLDLARFELAWQQLIERHDMLRAVVHPDGRQQILEHVPPYQIAVVDLRGKDSNAVAAELAAIREQMAHQVLPSDQWPLFEIRISRLDDQRCRLHFSLDILIGDAWSWQILIRELEHLYREPGIPLAPLELSFRDYVLAEAALHESDLYQRSLDYWRSRLPALPPAPELPLARNPASLSHPRFVRRSIRLKPDAWQQLKTRAARAGLTPSTALVTAFAQVLTAWSKSPRFTINLTLFHRLPLHPQVNDIVGDFTSLTMLAVDNTGQESFETLARRLQEQLGEDLDHRYVSGVRVLRELTRLQGGTQATMPVVFTSILAHPSDRETVISPHLDASNQDVSNLDILGDEVFSISQTPQVWLDHQVSEQGGRLVANWDAVEDLFPAGLLDDMFGAYCHLLHRLADEEETWRETTWQLVPPPPAQLEQRSALNATTAPTSE